jgi:sigma-B regulation protein RsbU (phosphoserine phosphatase)
VNLSFRILFLSLAAALLVSACTPAYSGKKQPVARNGVLDLRGWDFDLDGPLNLSGEWFFYWNKILRPDTCKDDYCLPASEIAVLPGRWSRHPRTGEVLPARGAASYCLTVLLNERYSRRILSLKIPEIRSASIIYVNDSLVNRDGIVACNEKDEQFGVSPAAQSFYPGVSRLTVILAISNFNYPSGGLTTPLLLGTETQITGMMKRALATDLFMFGSLMIIFLYHLTLYLLRRKEKSFLYFGLYCLLVGIFAIVSGNVSILVLIPAIPPGLVFFLFHASLYLTIPVFGRFLYWNFPGVIPLSFVRIIDPFPFVFLIIEALLPHWICSYTLNIYQIFIVLVIVVASFFLVKALIRGYEGMRVFLVGFVILIAAFANDALFYNRIILTGYFISQGLLLFILFQSFLLAYRFSKAFRSVETLTDKLALMNEDLADKVEERTEELNVALTEMESINESLITTNKSLEEASRIAERDMQMAVNVQNTIIFKDPPVSDEWDVACSSRPMAGVSGDFYDFYEIGKKLIGVGLFDVSGHGISSGLVTMIAKTQLFRLFRDFHETAFPSILNRLNRDLYRDIGEAYYFLTGLLVKFEGNTVYCLNAAHNDMLVRDSGGVKPAGEKDLAGHSGFLLGIKPEDFPYVPMSFTVQRGDILALFTDGMVESRNKSEEQFDVARIRQALTDAPRDSSRAILDHILQCFYEFIGDAEIKDDCTLIIMRRQ